MALPGRAEHVEQDLLRTVKAPAPPSSNVAWPVLVVTLPLEMVHTRPISESRPGARLVTNTGRRGRTARPAVTVPVAKHASPSPLLSNHDGRMPPSASCIGCALTTDRSQAMNATKLTDTVMGMPAKPMAARTPPPSTSKSASWAPSAFAPLSMAPLNALPPPSMAPPNALPPPSMAPLSALPPASIEMSPSNRSMPTAPAMTNSQYVITTPRTMVKMAVGKARMVSRKALIRLAPHSKRMSFPSKTQLALFCPAPGQAAGQHLRCRAAPP